MKKKLDKQERVALFQDDAKKVTKEICGNGLCYCNFDCGHSNKSEYMIPNIGKNMTCPLAKYNVIPDTRTFAEKLKAGERLCSIEEQMEQMFAVCACCEHVDVVENGDYFEIAHSDEVYHNYCLDCPIQKTMEIFQENIVETTVS